MNRTLFSTLLGTLLVATPLAAQEVLPRLTLAGRGLVSLNWSSLTRETGPSSRPLAQDFSDSHLLLRLDRKLYGVNRNQVAGTVLGFTVPEPESPAGPLYLSQLHVFWWGRTWEILAGRSRLETFVVEFPTLRDDDLLAYTALPNAYSYAPDAPEFELYGNLLRLRLSTPSARWRATLQAASLHQTDTTGAPDPELAGLQLLSAEVAWRLPHPLRFSGRFRTLGLRLDLQRLADDRVLPTATLGADVNLTRNPLANWRWRFQARYTSGLEDTHLEALATPAGDARARSLALVSSISLLRSPYQVPRLLLALTGGLRMYPDLDAWRASAVAGLFYQIGAEVDLGVQYQYETLSENLSGILGFQRSHQVNLLLSFEYETFLNHYFTDRETLLNLEHGFAP